MKLYRDGPIQTNNYNTKFNETAVENRWNPDEIKRGGENNLKQCELNVTNHVAVKQITFKLS